MSWTKYFKFTEGDLLVDRAGNELYVIGRKCKFDPNGNHFTYQTKYKADCSSYEHTREYIESNCRLLPGAKLRTLSQTVDNLRDRFPEFSNNNIDNSTQACYHPNKYINKAFISAFWVCPDCKKDLGNV